MSPSLEYLLSYLEEEFRNYPDVRIRVSPASGVKRSPDLVQDYDPSASSLHLERGVIVRTKTREYYFPVEWIEQKQFMEVEKLALRIRDAQGDSSNGPQVHA